MKLTIGWLYPDLMSIYGDKGNIIVLTKRCVWRDIEVEVKPIGLESSAKEMESCDLLMMGGAQDRQQTIVAKDLQEKKKTLHEMIEKGIPGVYICGGYQFLGKYYKEADGTIIEQSGLLDFYTENPGEEVARCIGNVALTIDNQQLKINHYVVGFENHGGRTYLGKNLKPLGNVIVGNGNNGKDKGEGILYKHSIGTYLHGPILPKNPEIADWLIGKALAIKYKKEHNLGQIDDLLAQKARTTVLQKLHISKI